MSETVNVVCYKSKTLKDGSHPLMVRVCKNGKKKYQSIGISILPSHWDFKRNEPNDLCPNSDEIKLLIQQRLYEIQKSILSNRIDGKDYTATTIINSVTEQTKSAKSVGEYYLTYIDNLRKENRIRYAGMYEVSYNSFIKFAKHLDIPFSDIDVAWLKQYEAWSKEQNLSVSTISTRLRHLRAVFNLAIMEQAIKSDCYPFHAYKVAKLHRETAKRALTKEDVYRVVNYEGTSPLEILAIDLFTFSYLCAGINFIDMAKLKHSNIRENQIVYNREKTKKLIIIPLQQKALQLIEKYRNDSTPYIFPILSPYHKTEVQIANRLHKVLAKINKYLKEIGVNLNLPMPLTTYVARHSFATVLKRAGVSTTIISESLGHCSEKITQVYLDSFDKEQINDAMSKLL